MAAELDISRIQFFAPAAPRLQVCQVAIKTPTPTDPADLPHLDVCQLSLQAPAPPVPAFLDISQVALKATLPAGQAPYSGVLLAHDTNLHNVTIRIADSGQL